MGISTIVKFLIRLAGIAASVIRWDWLQLDLRQYSLPSDRIPAPIVGITWSHEGSLILMCGAGLLLIGVIWWFASKSDHW